MTDKSRARRATQTQLESCRVRTFELNSAQTFSLCSSSVCSQSVSQSVSLIVLNEQWHSAIAPTRLATFDAASRDTDGRVGLRSHGPGATTSRWKKTTKNMGFRAPGQPGFNPRSCCLDIMNEFLKSRSKYPLKREKSSPRVSQQFVFSHMIDAGTQKIQKRERFLRGIREHAHMSTINIGSHTRPRAPAWPSPTGAAGGDLADLGGAAAVGDWCGRGRQKPITSVQNSSCDLFRHGFTHVLVRKASFFCNSRSIDAFRGNKMLKKTHM